MDAVYKADRDILGGFSVEIKKVLNDGKHLKQQDKVITFLTSKGYRTPKYVYVGTSDGGIEIAQPTKRDCIRAIERDNRLFPKL